jgi:GntR family transcriptional repressor for pyruvate dehydrogenase complex
LYEEVAERLRSLIADRGLVPGDRLPSERELSQRLGVSRTSVRQGLTALRSIGMIDVRRGDGVYLVRAAQEVVSPMALAMLNAEADHSMVWEVREALEVHAARLAATRATPDDLWRMQAALEAMGEAVEAGEEGTAADAELHEAILDAAHNPMLGELYRGIREAVARTSEASLSMPGRPPESLRAHTAIVEAIADRDSPRAASEMTSHLRGCARAFTDPTQS